MIVTQRSDSQSHALTRSAIPAPTTMKSDYKKICLKIQRKHKVKVLKNPRNWQLVIMPLLKFVGHSKFGLWKCWKFFSQNRCSEIAYWNSNPQNAESAKIVIRNYYARIRSLRILNLLFETWTCSFITLSSESMWGSAETVILRSKKWTLWKMW